MTRVFRLRIIFSRMPPPCLPNVAFLLVADYSYPSVRAVYSVVLSATPDAFMFSPWCMLLFRC